MRAAAEVQYVQYLVHCMQVSTMLQQEQNDAVKSVQCCMHERGAVLYPNIMLEKTYS